MQKIVYIISDIDKALAFEWIAQGLNREQFDLSFVLLNPGDSVLEQFLKSKSIPVTRITVTGKKDWLPALKNLYVHLRQLKPDVVHCHLLNANIIGLTAAKLARVPNRIYTRHHSSLHHIHHPKGVFWDKLSNRLATRIIAISAAVRDILINWEQVPQDKVTLIPHGFDLELFADPEPQSIEDFLFRHQLEDKKPIIGVIARFTQWKGVQFIIPAFRKLLVHYPDAVLLLLGAEGDYSKEILHGLEEIPLHNKRIIRFEPNIAAAYRTMDVFVHVPVDAHSEAFGQIYVEALAAGIPSVFTLSGIAPDFVEHEQNALVVPFCDSEAIYQSLLRLLSEKDLRERLKVMGWQSVKDKFALQAFIAQLENLYDR